MEFRVERLVVENFRIYDHLDLEGSARMMLLAENGRGKSSVIDAISWCILGRCRGVSKNGVGQDDLIKIGADSMKVSVTLKGIGTVTRQRGRNGSGTVTKKTDAILGKLGVSDAMLEAVLYSGSFFNLHHGDAKSMLLALLDVKINADDLPGIDLGKQTTVTLDELDALYTQAFNDRTREKQTLDAIQVPEPPKVVGIATAGKDAATLQKELADANQLLGRTIRAQADADNAAKGQRQQIADLLLKLASREQLIGSKATHDKMLTQHREQLTTAKGLVATVEAEPAEATDTLAAKVGELKLVIDRVKTHSPDRGCVLAASIPCLTEAKLFKGQMKQLADDVKALEVRIRAGSERAGRLAAAKQEVTTQERQVGYHETQITALDAKLADIDTARGQIDALEASLPDLDQAVTKETDARGVHEQDRDRLQTALLAVSGHQQALAAHQKAVERKAAQEDTVAKLEQRVAMLGPKGIRATKLQDAVAEFEDTINAALERFGFTIRFSIDPWQVFVAGVDPAHEDAAVRFGLLSKGQGLWTSLAFQLALTAVSGLEFCVIDDAEAIVGRMQQPLVDTIMTAPVGQIIMACAMADTQADPKIDGMDLVRIDQVKAA